MRSLSTILSHPDEIYPLLKLIIAITKAKKQIPHREPHLAFCYSILLKVSKSFSLVIQQLCPELRNAMVDSHPEVMGGVEYDILFWLKVDSGKMTLKENLTLST